ncbi:MAG: single-stranded DNA-binding protein [Planctomycetota bacterium]
MSSFNKVILMGRLTRDPELRYTQSNMGICKAGLAVNRRYKDSQSGEWKEEVTFVDVTIFGKRGEAFEKYHKKGSEAFFEGELRYDTWDDKNTGQKRSKLYVVANNWEFVGSGQQGERSGGYSEPREATAPAAASAAAPAAAGGGDAPQGGYGDYGGAPEPGFLEADDTPF